MACLHACPCAAFAECTRSASYTLQMYPCLGGGELDPPSRWRPPPPPFLLVPRYGYMPQRMALWIYWQAAVLLWKGVAFHGPPCGVGYRRAAEAAATHPPAADGCLFVWRPALKWPWR